MNSYKYVVLIFFNFFLLKPTLGQNFTEDSVNNMNVLNSKILSKEHENLSTYSISKVDGEVLDKTPTSSLFNTMFGLFPGVHVVQGSGEPGFEGSYLRIRGIGSYNWGNYIVFVDGFQTTTDYMRYMIPNEIESVSVFKDAASLVEFGMQGANGVIWIETKRGFISKKPKIEFNVKYGIQQPVHINKPLGSYEYATLYNEATSNDKRYWSPRYSEYDLYDYQEGLGVNTDWYNEVIKQSSPFVSAGTNVTGGTDLAKYFVLFDYTKTNGHYNVKTDDLHSNAQLEQFNIRSNFDFKLFGFIEGKVDLGGKIQDRRRPNYGSYALFNNLERYPNNIYPPVNENGSFPGTSVYPDNPYASIKELGYVSNQDRSLQANFSLKEDLSSIADGLYLTQSVSFNTWTRGTYSLTKNYARVYEGIEQTTDKNTNYSVYDDYGTNQLKWLHFKAGVGYDKDFGLSKIKSSLNYMQYDKHVDANMNGSSGNHIDYAFQNISGKLNYSYNNKYVGEFGFAVSGSDNYAKGNRFGFYPAISGAWILSNEDFVNDDIFNFLKLRGSLGKTGYDGVVGPRYSYQQYYEWTGSLPLGNSSLVTPDAYDIAFTANPDIFAEESLKLNFGIDSKIFNSLELTVDAFMDKRSGIISQDYNYISDVYGISPPYSNSGKVTTSGLEASLYYFNKIRDFSYSVGGNLSYYKDKIDYMPELPPASLEAWRTGKNIGSRFGYESIGFYDTNDFKADGTLDTDIPFPTFGEVQPGDIKYRDLNGDNVIDEKDILKIGDGDFPKLSFAILGEAQYKLLDFRILFQGAGMRDVDIFNNARNITVPFEDNKTVYEIAKGRWAYYPDQDIDTREDATYPRLSASGSSNNNKTSSFWIKDGRFIRLKNVEIGFNFSKEQLSKLKISKARIYLVGVNLYTWSPLLRDFNLDPEVLSGYPAIKSYNIGLAITF